jgi:hypothetical protein
MSEQQQTNILDNLKLKSAQNAIGLSQWRYCFNSCVNITDNETKDHEVNCMKNCYAAYNTSLSSNTLNK